MASVASSSPGPLNPGNVVSAALRLYRDRFKTYLKLSARATLWLLVPVYGWAKYLMHMGIMSRLAFQELINQPETLQQAQQQVKPKLWSFLGLGLLLVLIFLGAYIGLIIIAVLLGGVIGFILGGILTALLSPEIGVAFGTIVGLLLYIALLLVGLIWIVGRLFVADTALAIEADINANNSISRSWQLTKRSIVRIQFVVLAAYLITLPIVAVMNFGPQLALERVEVDSPAYWTLFTLTILLTIMSNILTLPFWQTIKGVLYYDLCSRREGLDLKI